MLIVEVELTPTNISGAFCAVCKCDVNSHEASVTMQLVYESYESLRDAREEAINYYTIITRCEKYMCSCTRYAPLE